MYDIEILVAVVVLAIVVWFADRMRGRRDTTSHYDSGSSSNASHVDSASTIAYDAVGSGHASHGHACSSGDSGSDGGSGCDGGGSDGGGGD